MDVIIAVYITGIVLVWAFACLLFILSRNDGGSWSRKDIAGAILSGLIWPATMTILFIVTTSERYYERNNG